MPFNVQHLGHVSADNIEALLVAAKSDPTLLPSFMSDADADKDTKESKPTKMVDSEDLDKACKPTKTDDFSALESSKFAISSEESRNKSTEGSSAESTSKTTAYVVSKSVPSDSFHEKANISGKTNADESHPPIPTRRSRPTPRPRSHIEVSPEEHVQTADAHITKPKPLTKPKTFKRPESTNFEVQENPRATPPKPEPYTQSFRSAVETSHQDLEAPPVVPQRRRKMPSRPMSVPSIPQYISSEASGINESSLTNVGQSLEEINQAPAVPNRRGPPPVPPRVDLE